MLVMQNSYTIGIDSGDQFYYIVKKEKIKIKFFLKKAVSFKFSLVKSKLQFFPQ